MKNIVLGIMCLLFSIQANAKTLQVGWGKPFLLPSIAAKFAEAGDVIEIDAGVYEKDAAVWKQNNLTIRGVNGVAHLKAKGAHAEGKGIWVVKGNHTVIENISFSEARVPDKNGAGIRIEGAGLTLRHCHFYDNENGILGGSNPNSDILIEHSEFSNNGEGSGQTHNIYIGAVRSFTLRYSYSHHAKIGHNVKSRAIHSAIMYNRIMDEAEGSASYAIDLSNGGQAFVIGNEIQQGPNTDNSTIVTYGAEGLSSKINHHLYFVHNTVVNDRPQGGRFLFVKPGAHTVQILNNLFIGKGSINAVEAEQAGNVFGATQLLVSAKNYDYHLRANSPAIDAGMDLKTRLQPDFQPNKVYQHTKQFQKREIHHLPDAGAHEWVR